MPEYQGPTLRARGEEYVDRISPIVVVNIICGIYLFYVCDAHTLSIDREVNSEQIAFPSSPIETIYLGQGRVQKS